MRITSTALIVAVAMAASMPGAMAQTPEDQVDLVVQEGFSELINVPGAFQDVAIGNPDILDIQPMTANTLLLNGIEQGTTNILIIDDAGQAIFRARVHVRPVDTWPNYRMKVTYGTSLAHSYTCARATGCPPKEAPPPLPPINNHYYTGDNVTVNATANAAAGAAAGQTAPAPDSSAGE